MKTQLVATVVQRFEEGEVFCESAVCLNARHKDAGCRLCVEACPAEAITLKAEPCGAPQSGAHRPNALEHPRIIADRCVACGLCVQRCPVDAFRERRAPEIRLAQAVAQLSDTAIAVVCPQHVDGPSLPASVATVVRHTRCLGALGPPMLLELSNNGTRALWLDDSPCRDCPIGRAHATIVATAATVNRLLAAFGRPPAVFVSGEMPVARAAAPARIRTVDGRQPGMSRRGLFAALGHLTKRTVAQAVVESLPPPRAESAPASGPRLPQQTPPSRRALRQQLARLAPAPETSFSTEGLPFAAVAIQQAACSACSLCARFCPTRALRVVTEGERFTLLFEPSACIDCGLCARVCPEQAIHFEDRLSPDDLFAGRARVVAAGCLAACAGCGAPTARRDEAEDNPRCFSCRASGGPAAPLRDSAGLLADLLGRLPAATSASPSPESEHGLREERNGAGHRTA